jgi:transcription antitermination factor NusG
MPSLLPNSWFAVQVVSRWEIRVGSLLEHKGYQPFAPTYLSRTQWSDRVKTAEKPLFPGYVFVYTPESGIRGLICSTPGVIRILSFGGRPVPIPNVEMDAVRKLTLLGRPVPTPYLNVGQKVEITDGPFAGVVGIIRQVRYRFCLVVSVQLISQSICIDVEECQLRPVTSTMRLATSAPPAPGLLYRLARGA